MKKALSILIIVVLAMTMVFSLAACDQGPTTKVAVFYYDFADTYIGTVRAELDKMWKGLSVDYYNFDGAKNQDTQNGQIDTAITQDYDLLVVNIVETGSADAALGIVAKAKTAGIPIVFFNREPTTAIFSADDWAKLNTAFIGTNYAEAGYKQGEMIHEYIMSNLTAFPNNDIKYLMFKGEDGNNEATARTIYSVLTANYLLSKGASGKKLVPADTHSTKNTGTALTGMTPTWNFTYGDIDVDLADAFTTYGTANPMGGYCYGNWSTTIANGLMETIISADPTLASFDIVIANNDDQALGVISALKTKNYNTGTAGASFKPVFGVDATSTAVTAIKAGQMHGSIKQSNVSMAQAIVLVTTNILAERAPANFDVLPIPVEGAGNNIVRIPYGIVTG